MVYDSLGLASAATIICQSPLQIGPIVVVGVSKTFRERKKELFQRSSSPARPSEYKRIPFTRRTDVDFFKFFFDMASLFLMATMDRSALSRGLQLTCPTTCASSSSIVSIHLRQHIVASFEKKSVGGRTFCGGENEFFWKVNTNFALVNV